LETIRVSKVSCDFTIRLLGKHELQWRMSWSCRACTQQDIDLAVFARDPVLKHGRLNNPSLPGKSCVQQCATKRWNWFVRCGIRET